MRNVHSDLAVIDAVDLDDVSDDELDAAVGGGLDLSLPGGCVSPA